LKTLALLQGNAFSCLSFSVFLFPIIFSGVGFGNEVFGNKVPSRLVVKNTFLEFVDLSSESTKKHSADAKPARK